MEFLGNNKVRVMVEPTGFVGAAAGDVDEYGGKVVAIGFGQSLEEVDFFGLSLCDALELRASLDRAIDSFRAFDDR